MARIMWVVCPECKTKFYVATDDFKGKERPMLCPSCGARFTDTQAKEVISDQG